MKKAFLIILEGMGMVDNTSNESIETQWMAIHSIRAGVNDIKWQLPLLCAILPGLFIIHRLVSDSTVLVLGFLFAWSLMFLASILQYRFLSSRPYWLGLSQQGVHVCFSLKQYFTEDGFLSWDDLCDDQAMIPWSDVKDIVRGSTIRGTLLSGTANTPLTLKTKSGFALDLTHLDEMERETLMLVYNRYLEYNQLLTMEQIMDRIILNVNSKLRGKFREFGMSA